MEMNDLIQQIKDDISYQEGKLVFLVGAKEHTSEHLLAAAAASKYPDSESVVINQSLTDATLNSMASLIDYYCMYCFMKMGVKKEHVTKVQYRPMNNYALASASTLKEQGRAVPSVGFLRAQFNKKITDMSQLSLGEISVHDLWPAFFGEAISSILYQTGILPNKKFDFSFASDRFDIPELIRKYHIYMSRLYCNEQLNSGVKYGLYVDINNCLKHNIVPYVLPKIEKFEDELRGFSYFQFKKESSIFLKPGLLKKLVELDFDKLREILDQMRADDRTLCREIEQEWGMGNILTLDKSNEHISSDQGTLYFFIDNVLMAKSRDATFVDSGKSLKTTLSRLLEDIQWGMRVDMSEFN